jgi:hypothetical protein
MNRSFAIEKKRDLASMPRFRGTVKETRVPERKQPMGRKPELRMRRVGSSLPALELFWQTQLFRRTNGANDQTAHMICPIISASVFEVVRRTLAHGSFQPIASGAGEARFTTFQLRVFRSSNIAR